MTCGLNNILVASVVMSAGIIVPEIELFEFKFINPISYGKTKHVYAFLSDAGRMLEIMYSQ